MRLSDFRTFSSDSLEHLSKLKHNYKTSKRFAGYYIGPIMDSFSERNSQTLGDMYGVGGP